LSDSKLETNPNSYFLFFNSSANSVSVYAILIAFSSSLSR
jgi:hypothetical protein